MIRWFPYVDSRIANPTISQNTLICQYILLPGAQRYCPPTLKIMKKCFISSRCLPAFLIRLGLIFTLRISAHALPPRMTLPLAFEANRGQGDAAAEFLARGENYSLFLTRGGGATLRLSSAVNKPPGNAVLRLRLVGARGDTGGAAENQLAERVNYFLGSDPARWRRGVPTFGQVKFAAVYPGVDLIYHGNQGRLEYDFRLSPAADAEQIALKFGGAENVRLAADGALDVKLAGGSVRWQRPVAWQEISGRRVTVPCEYALAGDTVHFLLGAYDRSQALVIDPVLLYSTYLGGLSSRGDSANAVATDAAGNVYFTGTESSGMFYFPAAQNNRDTGGSAAFVTKLDATGTNALFTTVIGGSGSDSGQAIALDGAGHIFLAGTTGSSDFPITNGFQTVSANGFLAELSADGSNILYSTYIGDSVNGAGEDGSTGTATSTNFPTTPGAFQTNRLGYSDAYVAELNSTGTALVFSTLLGGSGNDGYNAAGIALDADGNVYVTGQTDSKDFPTTPGAAQPTFGGGGPYSNSGDAFVAKLNPTGTALLWSTYLGGFLDDNATGITVDSNRNVYVTGNTASLNFPTRQAAQPPNLFDAYKFAAGTTNWTGLAVGAQFINVFAVDPVNSSNVYAGATRGGSEPVLYKSADGGLTWTGSDTGMPANFTVYGGFNYSTIQASVKALVVDPSNPNVLYAGFSSGSGIYISTNGGASWFAVTNGLPQLFFAGGRVVGALAVDPHHSQTVFAALGALNNGAGAIYRSADGGNTWSNVLAGGNGSVGFVSVAIDPVNSLNIYAANNSYGGFYKSADGGNTWTNLNSGLPV